MKYNQPYGVSDPDAAYINGNPTTGTMGSIPPAASIEFPQREIVALITASGITPDNAVLDQLAKATQSQGVNYAADAGTVNSLQVTLVPVPSYRDGMLVRVKVAQNNTGPATINLNALGARPIRRRGNVEILANDLVAGSISEMVYNAALAVFELLGVGGGGARGELTSNKDLYVNFAIGNDANDGTANDAAHAVKYIQRAINIAFNYAPSQYLITIHVADSQNYIGFVTPQYAGPRILIVGNEAAPVNVLVHGGQEHACYVTGINTLEVRGIKATTNPSGTPNPSGCFVASGYSSLTVRNCESGSCDGAVFQAYNAQTIVGSHRFASGSVVGNVLWGMQSGNVDTIAGAVFTFLGPLTCDVFAHSVFNSVVGVAPGGVTFTNGAAVTGKRYDAYGNGVISSLGGGVNYFPGTIAGTTSSGGQYT